jgi:hypothetical protein
MAALMVAKGREQSEIEGQQKSQGVANKEQQWR